MLKASIAALWECLTEQHLTGKQHQRAALHAAMPMSGGGSATLLPPKTPCSLLVASPGTCCCSRAVTDKFPGTGCCTQAVTGGLWIALEVVTDGPSLNINTSASVT